jgi:uncharacterized repeat protein (TIGR01451 family)
MNLPRFAYPLFSLALALMVLPSASQAQQTTLNYCQLEHIDPTYLSTLKGLGKKMGYANFELEDQGFNQGSYIATVFYELDSPLNYSTYSGFWGNATDGALTGAWGLYVYNIDTPQTIYSLLESSVSTDSSFVTGEINQSISNGLIEDRLMVNSYATGADMRLYVGENNLSRDPSSIHLIDSVGGSLATLGQTMHPMTFSPLATVRSASIEIRDFGFGESYELYGDLIIQCSDPNGNGVLAPQLSVSKSQPFPAPTVGVNTTYTITVTNNDSATTATATTATVVDVLPANVNFVSAGAGSLFTCTHASPNVTCTLNAGNSIAPGATATIEVVVMPTSAATLTNYVAVGATGGNAPPDATTCTALNAPSPGCGAPVVTAMKTGPLPVPTLSEWGMMLLAGLLAWLGLARVRRQVAARR